MAREDRDTGARLLAEPLLDAREAAKLLHVPRSTLYELVRSRGLPHVKVGEVCDSPARISRDGSPTTATAAEQLSAWSADLLPDAAAFGPEELVRDFREQVATVVRVAAPRFDLPRGLALRPFAFAPARRSIGARLEIAVSPMPVRDRGRRRYVTPFWGSFG